MINETLYAYSVARVRAVEKNLLNSFSFSRMLDAKNTEEALRVLAEAGYALHEVDFSQTTDYDDLLEKEFNTVISFINSISPTKDILKPYLLKFDFNNLKILIKKEVSLTVQTSITIPALSNHGSLSPDALILAITERSFNRLPASYGKAFSAAIEAFASSRDSYYIDLIVDKVLFSEMSHSAFLKGNPRISVDIVKSLADLCNIKTLIRIKGMKRALKDFKTAFIDVGKLSYNFFKEIFNDSSENLNKHLEFTLYGDFLSKGITQVISGGSYSLFEKLSDDYITGLLKPARYSAFGPEPLIAYLLAKETEIKNVRIILSGKINGLQPEMIKERLREPYV